MSARRAIGTVIALGVLVAAASARAAPPPPLRVSAASLLQQGQQLVWRIVLAQPFSPRRIRQDHRSLCLVIERPGNHPVPGQLCIVGPQRGQRRPRVVFEPISPRGPGRDHVIAATVTRGSTRELSAAFLPTEVGIGYGDVRWQVDSGVLAPACVPSPSVTCDALFPTRPALARVHSPIPIGCVPRGQSFVTSGPTDRRVVALTFDDGPWYDTPQFLDVLEREHVPATFFQIGEQIGTYGSAVDRRMLADGDMIGDHTWNHADVAGAGAFAASEISGAAVAIRGITGGFRPCLFRAPGGSVSPALIAEARSMGFMTIQWDVDPRDWARPGTDAIYQNVVSNARPGAIILQHDGGGDRSETLAALPREISTLRSEGYGFVTVTDLLGIRVLYR